MGLLKDFGNWLEDVASAATTATLNESAQGQVLTDAEMRVIESSSRVRAVGRVLNGKINEQYDDY